MIFHGWQANTTGEDVVAEGLEPFGAFNVVTIPVAPASSQEYPEFTWDVAVDTDDDILDVLCQCLWYNDRTPEQISAIRSALDEQLRQHRRIGEKKED